MKVNINPAIVAAKVDNAWHSGLPRLTEEILNDCNQYCKDDTGMLIQSSYVMTEFIDGIIIWQTPYARRQYWAIETAYKDKNPKATWKWCEVAKQHHLDQWQRQAQKLLEMNL